MQIAFVGGGVMGEAMISGILAKGIARASDIAVGDTRQPCRDALSQKYGVEVGDDNRRVIQGAEVVVLAIKPQDLNGVMKELREPPQGQLYLSIVAGAKLDNLCLGLSHPSVVRAMPNMPAQIGEGISVWTATAEVSQQQREWAGSMLSALGKEVYVPDERYVDMATAVSGSGPAYIFLIIESLIDAAVHIGLPRQLATELVLQTMGGSLNFLRISGRHPAELKDMVTSPGGTTVEGLLQLEQGGLRAALNRATLAAYEKAKKLGGTTEK
jgi:pyrroline-5-carboxylate reductase